MQRGKRIWIALLVLVLSSLACALPGGNNNSPAEELRPTTAADARRISTPDAGNLPQAPEPVEGYQFYRHPSGTFELNIPEGWTIETDEAGSMYAAEPGSEGAIYITVTYTGHELSGEDFERFITAREANFFNYFDTYVPGEREINADKNAAAVDKTIEFNGIPDTVTTFYFRTGYAVFVVDTWMETSRIEEYQAIYEEVMKSFVYSSDGAENFYLYNYVWVLADTEEQFSFEAPICWAYRFEEPMGMVIDQFWAPDERAFLSHTMVYKNGTFEEDKLEEKVFAYMQDTLEPYTRGLYVITKEEIADGIYRIEWAAEESGWNGLVQYQLDNGHLFMLVGGFEASVEASYRSTIIYGLDYYAVPAAQE